MVYLIINLHVSYFILIIDIIKFYQTKIFIKKCLIFHFINI
jgi:hypothetical protein